jgi:hypothetical protein
MHRLAGITNKTGAVISPRNPKTDLGAAITAVIHIIRVQTNSTSKQAMTKLSENGCSKQTGILECSESFSAIHHSIMPTPHGHMIFANREIAKKNNFIQDSRVPHELRRVRSEAQNAANSALCHQFLRIDFTFIFR